MNYKFVFICLLGLSLFFSSCPMCEDESEAEFYSRNPYCVFYIHNQTDKTICARVDGKYNDGKNARWISESHKEIKAGEMDSLCVLSQTPNGRIPRWIDVKRYAYRDSLQISVFVNFEDMAGYTVGEGNNTSLKQYTFVVEEMEPNMSKDIYIEKQ